MPRRLLLLLTCLSLLVPVGTLTGPAAAASSGRARSLGAPARSVSPRIQPWRPTPYRRPSTTRPAAVPKARHGQARHGQDRSGTTTPAGTRYRGAEGAQLATTAAGPAATAATTASSGTNGRVLILDTTVTGGASSIEAQEAAADGFGVDIVDGATWSAMTADQFAAYRAILLGDATCTGESAVAPAEANAMVWGPVVNGNIDLIGTDPVYHATYTNSAISAVTQRGIDFATARAGTTGAYISLSCYFEGASTDTHVSLLDGLDPTGTGFSMRGAGCYDAIHIEASSPALQGIDDPLLSGWGCSVHETFQSWPSKFGVLAVDTDAGSLYEGQDGTFGNPYILAFPGGTFLGSTENAGGGSPDGHDDQCQSGGYPINCVTGEMWHTYSDVTVPGRGPALSLTRTYSSLEAGTDSPFGFGWNSSYTMSLAKDPASGAVQVTQENGATTVFNPGGGGYTAPPRVYATLTHESDGTWTFVRHQREKFVFDATGRLTSIADLNGYTTVLTYGSDGRLATVSDPESRALTFAYGADGRVSSVTDPAGRATSYSYDAAGELTGVTDPSGSAWHFGYATDGTHLMTSMTDALGASVTTTYDSTGRAVSQTDRAGHTTTYQYGDAQTTITDPLGAQTVESYTQGMLVQSTRAAGTPAAATWKFSYDGATLAMTSQTDPNGHTTSYGYTDGSYAATSVTDALGHVTTRTYNGLEEPLTVTDASGETTTSTYDAAGNPLTVSRPVSPSGPTQTTTYHHDDPVHVDDITSMTTPEGSTWSYGYDTYGDVISATDPLGNRSTSAFDVTGRRTGTVSARGNASGADPSAYLTTFGYDAFGDLTARVDPLGRTAAFGYDADHRLVSTKDTAGKLTGYTLDAEGRRLVVTRPDGTTLSSTYDAAGRLVSQTDGAGHTTRYGYDALGHQTSSTDPLGRVTSMTVDGTGAVLTRTAPNGQVATYGYDAVGENTSITYSDGKTPSAGFEYSATGHVTQMTDGSGTSTYSYDALGRLTGQRNGAGQTVGYGYDVAGHLTSLTYPNGKTVSRSYDAAGRLSAVTDWNGHTTTMGYDADSELTAQADPNGVSSTTSYDAAGQLTGVSHSLGGSVLTSFAYALSTDGKVTGATTTPGSSGLSDPAHTYSYTQLDQLAGTESGSFSYDAADNPTKLPDGTTMTYDAADEIATLTSAGRTTPISYDQDGNRLTGPTVGSTATTATYDAADRLSTVTGGTASGGNLLAGGQYHSLAVSGGAVYAWGLNSTGQLGDGTTTTRTAPVRVGTLSSVASVAAGAQSSLALSSSGSVSAWGLNTYGQLGDGTTTTRTTPVAVKNVAGATAVAAGNYHGLAVLSDGTVSAWGLNNAGQLGDGTTTSRSTAVKVKGLTGVVAVAAGGLPGYAGHSLALTSSGAVYAWGYGKSGQLGLGSLGSTPTPTKVNLPTISAIAAGGDDSYALATDGSVWAWGDNAYGQLGTTSAGHTESTPVKVSITSVRAIAAGGTHALAVRTDGTVWGWGNNNTGQLGDGGTCGKTCTAPVQSKGIAAASAVAAGYVHSLAATTSGSAYAWGRNAEGEVGDGTTTARLTPTRIASLAPVVSTPSVDVSFSYDARGLRASKRSGARTETYAWDEVAGPQLLLTDGTTSYVYGTGGSPIEQIGADGTTTSYFQLDGQGSTRLLTSASGAVTATFSYGPTGTLTSKTGTADTALRWTGQQQDVETGLYYLRARYYDPSTTSFLTRDPFVVTTHAPYSFAGDDAVNGADPSGLCWPSWACGIEHAIGDVFSTIGGWFEAAANWVYDNSSTISAVTGTLALIPIPGVQEVLAGISVATGVLAASKDVSEGNYGLAAVDSLGVIAGVGGIGAHLGSFLYTSAAADALGGALEAERLDQLLGSLVDFIQLNDTATKLAEGGELADRLAAGLADIGAGLSLLESESEQEPDPEPSDTGACP